MDKLRELHKMLRDLTEAIEYAYSSGYAYSTYYTYLVKQRRILQRAVKQLQKVVNKYEVI